MTVQQKLSLTKNQTLVFDTLSKADNPLSAYSILDILRDAGLRAPLQVYRALDKLCELGLVHRLETLNSFVACSHPDCTSHNSMGFIICGNCNSVSEIADVTIQQQIEQLAKEAGFSLSKSTLELRGLCSKCLKSRDKIKPV